MSVILASLIVLSLIKNCVQCSTGYFGLEIHYIYCVCMDMYVCMYVHTYLYILDP